MKKTEKTLCRIALIAVALLGVLAAFAGCSRKPENVVEKSVEVTDAFSAILVKNGLYRIHILPSEDGSCSVRFEESELTSCAVAVENNRLTVRQKDLRPWYEKLFTWELEPLHLTLCLPMGDYEELTVKSASGSVAMECGAFRFGEVGFYVSSGELQAEKLACETLSVKLSSGNVGLDECRASSFSMNVSSGELQAEKLACETLSVKLSSGNVGLDECRVSSFSMNVSSGSATLSDTVAAGHTEIKLSSGSVTLRGFDSKTAEIKVSSGNVKGTILTAKKFETEKSSGTIWVPTSNDEAGLFRIRVSSGNVDLELPEG